MRPRPRRPSTRAGAGKSTQIPQLILEAADAAGAPCRIVVSAGVFFLLPRSRASTAARRSRSRGASRPSRSRSASPRSAARRARSATATRAPGVRRARRLEDAARAQVGYSVRLDRRGGPQTRLEFCTVGVLLRRLAAGDCAATHVVVDEAHERDALTDFLLVVLKTRTLTAAAAPKVEAPASALFFFSSGGVFPPRSS